MGTVPWAASTSGCLRPPNANACTSWRQRRSISVKIKKTKKKSVCPLTVSLWVSVEAKGSRREHGRSLGQWRRRCWPGRSRQNFEQSRHGYPNRVNVSTRGLQFPSQRTTIRCSSAGISGWIPPSSSDNCHLEYRSMEASFCHILLSMALNTWLGFFET